MYTSTVEFREKQARGVSFQKSVFNHKKEAIEIAGQLVVVPKANSDRPAFVILENDKELLHLYPAMGLAKQHFAQQMLLAFVGSKQLALTLLKAAAEVMGTTMRSATLTFQKGQQEGVKELWKDFWNSEIPLRLWNSEFWNSEEPVVGTPIPFKLSDLVAKQEKDARVARLVRAACTASQWKDLKLFVEQVVESQLKVRGMQEMKEKTDLEELRGRHRRAW